MAIIKPFTFRAGEKARAAEVNQDFDILYQEVNNQSSEIQSLEDDITSIENSKANINGNSSQRFAVADAVGSYDAVNKNVLEEKSNELKEYTDTKVGEVKTLFPVPDYSSKTTVSNPYTVSEPCFISHYGYQGYNGGTNMSINNQTVWQTGGGLDASQGTNWVSGVYLCKPGDVVRGSSTVYKYNILWREK